VFGWRFQDLPTPDGRSYAQAFLGDDLVAVVAPQNPQQEAAGTPAQWNIYFAAADARAVAEEAPHAGGTLQFGPEAVGDTGVMVFVDPPGGGTTGVWHEVTEYPQDDGGTYTTLMVDDAEVAGIAATDEAAGWQIYFGVSDVADTVRKAVEAGAEVLIAPEAEDQETPGATATLKDPQGGIFSLLEV
jgi:predicted enzyme related to lactoylglutathione lyase